MAASSNLPSLGTRLDGAQAKLQRANRQIRALKQSLRLLSKSNVYENGAAPYDPGKPTLPATVITRGGKRVTLINSVALTISLTPKIDLSPQYLRWGVLMGEIAHNIGSALDNLIWELSQPLPIAPIGANSAIRGQYDRQIRQIAFPYTKQRTDWAGRCSTNLRFITDSSVRGVIEEAQAFYAWEHEGTDQETFPLQIVHELWIRDKHHAINVLAAGLEFQVMRIRIPSLFPGIQDLPSQLVRAFPMRPIVGKTEMAIVLVHFPHEIELPDSGEIELDTRVNPSYTLAVQSGQGAPAEGLDAIDSLQKAHKRARELVSKFV